MSISFASAVDGPATNLTPSRPLDTELDVADIDEVVLVPSSNFLLETLVVVGAVALWMTRNTRETKNYREQTWSSLAPGAVLAGVLAVYWVQPRTFHESVNSLFMTTTQLVDWYLSCLDERPLLTKSSTTAFVQALSDYFAQVVEQVFSKEPSETKKATTQAQPTTWRILWNIRYDLRRGVAIAADGFFLSGPLLHYGYELLEKHFPTENDHASSSFIYVLLHIFVNDYMIDTLYLFISFVFVAIAEGHVRDLWSLFRKDFPATVQASWGLSILLTPVEYLCFGYLPLKLRVLYMNFIDVLWSAVVSYMAHRSRRIPQTS